jgi:hypothetical protein
MVAQTQKLIIMQNYTLDVKSKNQVLIPTGNSKYPFVIKVQDDRGINEYWLLRADGTLTGDGFLTEEKETYPQYLSNI